MSNNSVQIARELGMFLELYHFRSIQSSTTNFFGPAALWHPVGPSNWSHYRHSPLPRHLPMSGTWMEFVQTQEDSYGTAAQQFPPLASRGGARHQFSLSFWTWYKAALASGVSKTVILSKVFTSTSEDIQLDYYFSDEFKLPELVKIVWS